MTPAERQAALAVAERETPGDADMARFYVTDSPYSAFHTEESAMLPKHVAGDFPFAFLRRDVADAYADAAYAMGVAAHEQTAREKILRRTAESDQAYATVRELRSKLEEAEARATAAEARVNDFVVAILDEGYSAADSLGFVQVGESTHQANAPNMIEYARAIRAADAAKGAG